MPHNGGILYFAKSCSRAGKFDTNHQLESFCVFDYLFLTHFQPVISYRFTIVQNRIISLSKARLATEPNKVGEGVGEVASPQTKIFSSGYKKSEEKCNFKNLVAFSCVDCIDCLQL